MNTWIVIVTWNNADYFEQCISSLEENTAQPAYLVHVDNGSRPDEQAQIYKAAAGLRGLDGMWNGPRLANQIQNPDNKGIPVAQNQALDFIEMITPPGQPYGVVLLDADTTVEPAWLYNLLTYADAHPDVGIVGGAKSPQGNAHPVYYHNDGRWYVHDKQHVHPSGFTEGESIDFACAYLRPELLLRGLRMDEGYELYDGHDQDLCFRVRSWGYRIEQIDAGVLHYGSAAMKAAGYQWDGGGRHEWDELRAKNIRRFVDIWSPFLAERRQTVEAEIEHMRAMNAKLIAEAGDRKQVP